MEVSNNTAKFNERVFRPDQTSFMSQQRADIEIRDVRHTDAGIYVCEVELFMADDGVGRGNGTRLLVLDAPGPQGPEPGTPRHWMPLYIGAGVAVPLLAAAALTLCLRCRRGARHPVDRNTAVLTTVPGKGRKGTRIQTTNPKQKAHVDQIQYATLSIKEGKRKSRSHEKVDEVVYSRIRPDARADGSIGLAENGDHVLYTRVNISAFAETQHRPREMPENVVYAKMSLNG